MCLAVPGKVVKKEGKYGTVDFGKSKKKVKLALLSEVGKGDKVLVHAGFAIEKLKDEVQKKG